MSKLVLIERRLIGLLGFSIPILSFVCALFVKDKPDYWFHSISLTYYVGPMFPILLCLASFVMMIYKTSHLKDKIINFFGGFFGVCTSIFPCYNPYGIEKVGIFQLQNTVSDTIHSFCAIAMFFFLTFNIAFLFTKGKSKFKNIVYMICAFVMGISIILYLIYNIVMGFPRTNKDFSVYVIESFLIFGFSFAWLVKGKLFFPTR